MSQNIFKNIPNYFFASMIDEKYIFHCTSGFRVFIKEIYEGRIEYILQRDFIYQSWIKGERMFNGPLVPLIWYWNAYFVESTTHQKTIGRLKSGVITALLIN